LQAEGMRYAIEARRRDMYHNSGTLPWQFNEPYPMASCTSAVDYYAQPKPLYYAVARAYAPISVSAQFVAQRWNNQDHFEANLWITNSGDQAIEAAMLDACLINTQGQVFAEQSFPAAVLANTSQHVALFDVPTNDPDQVFFLDLTLTDSEHEIAHNSYVFTRADDLNPLFSLPQTSLSLEQDGDSLTLTNTGQFIATYIWIEDARELASEGYLTLSDNYFCLLPGASHMITLSWHNAAEHRLKIDAWNVPATEMVMK
jgi:beta-mannosidase